MSDMSTGSQKLALGVGTIISDSFSILFSNIVKVMIIGFSASLIGYVVNGLFVGFGQDALNNQLQAQTFAEAFLPQVIPMIVGMAIYGLVTAMIIQLAYDAKLGRSNSIGEYFRSAMPAVVPIAILYIVVSILVAIGAVFLVVPGLWIAAVFFVVAPAAVIDGSGFGALGRSAQLTKEYRWPIVGLILLLFIILLILSAVVGAAVFGIIFGASTGAGGIVVLGIVTSLLNGLIYGFGGIIAALTYARLREIKEGVGMGDIVSVFD